MVDVLADCVFEIGHAGEAVTPNAVLGDVAEDRSTMFSHEALEGVKS